MESKINEWIVNRLSINLPEFNNLPACPFAKEALVNNKILIQELDTRHASRLSMKEYFLAEQPHYMNIITNSAIIFSISCYYINIF